MFQPFYRNNKNGNYKLHQDNLVTLRGAFEAMFWSILDPGQADYAAVLNNTGSCYREDSGQAEDFDYNCLSGEFSHTMSRVFWGFYQFIIVIMLLNILIAMSEYLVRQLLGLRLTFHSVNTTYQRVWDNADLEWKYSKSDYQIQFLFPRAVLPGPFKPLYYLAQCVHWRRHGCIICILIFSYDDKVSFKREKRELKNTPMDAGGGQRSLRRRAERRITKNTEKL